MRFVAGRAAVADGMGHHGRDVVGRAATAEHLQRGRAGADCPDSHGKDASGAAADGIGHHGRDVAGRAAVAKMLAEPMRTGRDAVTKRLQRGSAGEDRRCCRQQGKETDYRL